jgi:hypothetical protein
MKRAISLLTAASVLMIGAALISFTNVKGGDSLEIYAGGKQLLQQFFHMDKSVKTLQLNQAVADDKIEVYYSHCGVSGKSRVLTVKDSKDNILKQYKFADVKDRRDAMSFRLRDVQKKGTSSLKLYYTSKEMPDGKLLAMIALKNENLARR